MTYARLFAAVAAAALLLGSTAHAQLRLDGDPVQMTETGFMQPVWSPDGSRIAFTGSGYGGIWVMDLDTRETTQITDEPAGGFGFQWSPDGSAILAQVARYDGPRRSDAVKIFDVDSGDEHLLTEYRSSISALPRWDETGSRVVLFAEGTLEVFDAGRGILPKQAEAEHAVLAAGGEFVRANLDQSRVEPLDVLPGRDILNLVASADGSKVAFEVLGGHLHVMNSDGSGLVELGPGNRPAWSPDGEWVVFMRTEDDGHVFTGSELWAARADGSEPVRLTNTPGRLEMNPSWSPDGSRLAFDDLNDGAIYVVSLAR